VTEKEGCMRGKENECVCCDKETGKDNVCVRQREEYMCVSV